MCCHIILFTFTWKLLHSPPPRLSIHHQYSPSLGRRASISLETACHTAHSQHQTVPMHRHHSPPLPTACSQRLSSLQIKELCCLSPFSSSSFPSWLSQACVFQGHRMLPHSKRFIRFSISNFCLLHCLPCMTYIYFSKFVLSEKKQMRKEPLMGWLHGCDILDEMWFIRC